MGAAAEIITKRGGDNPACAPAREKGPNSAFEPRKHPDFMCVHRTVSACFVPTERECEGARLLHSPLVPCFGEFFSATRKKINGANCRVVRSLSPDPIPT